MSSFDFVQWMKILIKDDDIRTTYMQGESLEASDASLHFAGIAMAWHVKQCVGNSSIRFTACGTL